MDKIKLLSKLYFPELHSEVNETWVAHLNSHVFIMQISNRFRAASNIADVNAQQAALKEFSDGWIAHYLPTQQALKALEIKASDLMATINSI